MRRSFLGLFVVVGLAAAVTTAASASASAPTQAIEGVWSFNGGAVIVAPGASGRLVGTVTSPTTFGPCAHPVGQQMWSGLRATTDGMYIGWHLWYRGAGSNCQALSELGPTAFRVLAQGNGSFVLRVCFNHPGTKMPMIARDGSASNVNYGCRDSAPVADVPTSAPSFAESFTLPAATVGAPCVSLRDFPIHIREPKHDPFVRLTVFLGHRVFKMVRHGENITATIDLRGLPKSTYTVRIVARTAAGFIVRGSRTYHTCVPKRHRS
jgi:hypothetical protein